MLKDILSALASIHFQERPLELFLFSKTSTKRQQAIPTFDGAQAASNPQSTFNMHTFSIRAALANAFRVPLNSAPRNVSSIVPRASFSTSSAKMAKKKGAKPDRRISECSSAPSTRHTVSYTILTSPSHDPLPSLPSHNPHAATSPLLPKPLPPTLDHPSRMAVISEQAEAGSSIGARETV
jgi:hypothetical protein